MPRDIPGFYYDPQKKKYFKITSSGNNINQYTVENLRQKELQEESQVNRNCVPRQKSFAPLKILQERQQGKLKPHCFQKHTCEKAITKLNCAHKVKPFPPYRYPFKGTEELNHWLALAPDKLVCSWSEKYKPYNYMHVLDTSAKQAGLHTEAGLHTDHENSCCVNFEWNGYMYILRDETITSISAAEPNIFFTSVDVKASSFLYHVLLNDGGLPESFKNKYLFEKLAVWSVKWSSVLNQCAVGTEDGIVMLDIETGKKRRFQKRANTFSQCFSEDSRILYSGTSSGDLNIHDVRRDDPYFTKRYPGGIWSVNACDDCLLIGCFDGNIYKVDLRNNQEILQFKGHHNTHHRIPLHINKPFNIICSAGEDGNIRIWDYSSGKLIHIFAPSTEVGKIPNVHVSSGTWAKQSHLEVLAAVTDTIYVYSSPDTDVQ